MKFALRPTSNEALLVVWIVLNSAVEVQEKRGVEGRKFERKRGAYDGANDSID